MDVQRYDFVARDSDCMFKCSRALGELPDGCSRILKRRLGQFSWMTILYKGELQLTGVTKGIIYRAMTSFLVPRGYLEHGLIITMNMFWIMVVRLLSFPH